MQQQDFDHSERRKVVFVVAESLFANTPVAMMQNVHIGSRAYVNARRVRYYTADTMHLQLSEMMERSASFHRERGRRRISRAPEQPKN